MFTKNFKELSKDDAGIAGGKGASLGEMTQAGIPVPPGFVVLADSFEAFLKETDLLQEVDAILEKVNHKEIHTIDAASEKIRGLILNAEMPKDIGDEIMSSYKALDSKYVAIRSSATAEDGMDHAWAGQLESYLNTTEDDVLTKAKLCWSSLFTPRAIFYRFEKGLHLTKISVAVVIQKMVESEVSGIAFSVHPVTEDYNQIIIEAGFGLGEAIVSGSITPDSYVVEKEPRNVLDINISTQTRGLYRSENRSAEHDNNEWIDIPEPKASSQVLTSKQILDLSEVILNIEKHYGFPCDIEWAHEAGKFYIVQSRPITTLSRSNKDINTEVILGPISQYTRLFQFPTMPYLLNDMLLKNYTHLSCLFLFNDNVWISYLPNQVVEKTLEEGLSMFKDESLFEKWESEYREYIKQADKYFNEVVVRSELTKNDTEKFIQLLCGCHFFYIKTEFFYTDSAYQESATNLIIKKHLKRLENIKNDGRAFLNKMALEGDSYLMKILAILSRQFNQPVTSLLKYSLEEIVSLFDGNTPESEMLDERSKTYICIADGEKSVLVIGKGAKQYYDKFFSLINKSVLELKGVTANRGKATGRVKMMFYGFDNFHLASQLMNEMKKGEILVAETTSPEIMPACNKAAAILTNEGGLLSHAAIVSRELHIPCIVSLGNLDKILKDGDMVEVDADNGIVRII